MSKLSVARSYAKGIILSAKTNEELAEWSSVLEFLAQIMLLPEVKSLVQENIRKTKELTELFLAIGKTQLSDKAKNLVKLLIERKRLDYLPEIAASFEVMRNEKENKVQLTITSAVALSDAEKNTIGDFFKQALSRQVEIKNEINPTLVGGYIARAGNYVLNNSLQNRLAELKEVMDG